MTQTIADFFPDTSDFLWLLSKVPSGQEVPAEVQIAVAALSESWQLCGGEAPMSVSEYRFLCRLATQNFSATD